MYLFFDTETTGKEDWNFHVLDSRHWPRMVEIGWLLYDKSGNEIQRESHIIKPVNFTIPDDAVAIHGITTDHAVKKGISIKKALNELGEIINQSELLISHNIDFDIGVVVNEFQRNNLDHPIFNKNRFCTMKNPMIIEYCKIPSSSISGKYKWPSLSELYFSLFNENVVAAHSALIDAKTCAKCFFKLISIGVIKI